MKRFKLIILALLCLTFACTNQTRRRSEPDYHMLLLQAKIELRLEAMGVKVDRDCYCQKYWWRQSCKKKKDISVERLRKEFRRNRNIEGPE